MSAEAPSLTVEEAREIITASSWTSTGAAGDLLDFRESLNRQRTEMPAEVWRLVVRDNKVSVQTGEITFSNDEEV